MRVEFPVAMYDERLRPWRVLASRRVIDAPHLHVRADRVETSSGAIIENYFIRESAGFTVIFALTDDERVVLVRQYKHGAGDVVLELPAGGIDDGESAEACARRELAEETGYTAEVWEHVGTFINDPTNATVRLHLYLARGATPTQAPAGDDTESIVVETATLAEVRAMLRDGRIVVAPQVASIWAVFDYLGLVQAPLDAGPPVKAR